MSPVSVGQNNIHFSFLMWCSSLLLDAINQETTFQSVSCRNCFIYLLGAFLTSSTTDHPTHWNMQLDIHHCPLAPLSLAFGSWVLFACTSKPTEKHPPTSWRLIVFNSSLGCFYSGQGQSCVSQRLKLPTVKTHLIHTLCIIRNYSVSSPHWSKWGNLCLGPPSARKSSYLKWMCICDRFQFGRRK